VDTLKYILRDIHSYVLWKNIVAMKEKVHEDGTKATKPPSMIYSAKWNDNILYIHPWQNEGQWMVNNDWFCFMGDLSGDWLQPFINEVLTGLIRQRVVTRSMSHSENECQQSHNKVWSCKSVQVHVPLRLTADVWYGNMVAHDCNGVDMEGIVVRYSIQILVSQQRHTYNGAYPAVDHVSPLHYPPL